ncbi:hypothetical protein E8E12_008604 [Didymella heteroderae]|uniref:Uncharacterized protein n=1 Tax=Didymella heteroderae TaxID=1769908 RepID=A0A9P4WV51_9PLEO|nr:hypothetical protein E8E12_008604 [Didymella heteroderae]
MARLTPVARFRGCTPGTVIMYREPGATVPLWPSIYLTDDATPKGFLRTRPRGLYSVVLKLARVVNVNHLRWAQMSQMGTFDPCAADEKTKHTVSGLQEAYDAALDALDAQFDLSYWKAILASSQTPELGPVTTDHGDFENDPEMQQAILMGIIDVGLPKKSVRKESPALQGEFTTSFSRSPRARSRDFIPDQHASGLSLSLRQRPQPTPTPLTPAPSPPNDRNPFGFSFRPLKRSSPPSPAHSDDGLPSPTQRRKFDECSEEDFDKSNQFVQVFVGPETDPTNNSDIDPQRRRYKLQLLKHHVWDRTYFRDSLSGRNYIEPIGDNTWELVHPRLVDISPEDFRWAAEYLSDGDFGHREPETEEEVAEAFAQCMSAWRTAELLDMDDLLEHIVHKIRCSQPWWDLWNVMAFAVSIYQSEVPIQAHDELKAIFSEFIAEFFYIYLEDDHLSGTFTDRLKQLPELERDVVKKRLAQLELRAQPQEEEYAVSQEAERQDDDVDLYS